MNTDLPTKLSAHIFYKIIFILALLFFKSFQVFFLPGKFQNATTVAWTAWHECLFKLYERDYSSKKMK